MKLKALLISGLMISSLYGAEDFNSEASHFVGGAVLAGGITAVIDEYYPEYRSERGILGFEISSAAIILEQTGEYIANGNARGQLLDAASHIAGSAFGAWITDQYILSPIIVESASEGKYVGFNLRHSF